MTLTAELKAYNQKMRAKVSPEKLAVIDEATDALKRAHLAENALQVGDQIPRFNLPNALGKSIAVADILEESALLISFYRGAWCPYCNLELRALQNALPEFKAKNVQLVAISPQDPDHSLSLQEKHQLNFEVLSDANNEIARQFGLVFQLPRDLRSIYNDFNIDVPGHNGEQSYELPMPATYLVNQKGEIVYAFVDEQYAIRADVADILAATAKL